MCPYCCTSLDCISWKPGDGLKDTLFDLSPFSCCLTGVFDLLPFLEVSFPAVLLDASLGLRSGVPLQTLRANLPSEICGLPHGIFPATLVLGVPKPEASGDSSTTLNNKEEDKKKRTK